ncbi:hypothetical protein [Burkholderia aenigmatica]|uniref:hypothetical protein n=1 Tax=Burkholderia aenigmatica TaxID=2015348 RepID=UPI00264D8697|nr:hypothetical protein [Burkholderia aenigmatica]MDN7876630.1 hypothetical protein [Burkholderia aenigmatica]
MKRAGFSLAYWIAGLITTWFACWIGSRIDWRIHTGSRWPSDQNACHEIDLCSPPWSITALLIAFLIGPSLAFAFAGWRVGRQRVTALKLVSSLVALVTSTMLFYIATYVIR